MKFSKAEVDAIIEASPRTFVPFNKLVLSEDHQARSATAPVMSLPELAASIKDSGVLQNLVVVQAARGRYEVCAGGRRLAALTLLVAARKSVAPVEGSERLWSKTMPSNPMRPSALESVGRSTSRSNAISMKYMPEARTVIALLS